MDQKKLYVEYANGIKEFAKESVAEALMRQIATHATIVPQPKKHRKKGNEPFVPTVAERAFNRLVKQIIINRPTIIVYWFDGTRTRVTCDETDRFDPKVGVCIAFTKKFLTNTGNYNQILARVIKNAIDVTDKTEMRKKKRAELKRKKKGEDNGTAETE